MSLRPRALDSTEFPRTARRERQSTARSRKQQIGPSYSAAVDGLPLNTFFFQQRHGRVDLRSISRIDMDRVVENVDIDVLQDHLENLAFCELHEEDMRAYTDDQLLKLFRLAQLTIEYLVNVQNTLYEQTVSFQAQCAEVEKEDAQVKLHIEEQNEEIGLLKRELKQRRKTIATYEALLSRGPLPGAGAASDGLPAGVVACDLCDKAFSSRNYLKRHRARKHGKGRGKGRRRRDGATAAAAAANKARKERERVHEKEKEAEREREREREAERERVRVRDELDRRERAWQSQLEELKAQKDSESSRFEQEMCALRDALSAEQRARQQQQREEDERRRQQLQQRSVEQQAVGQRLERQIQSLQQQLQAGFSTSDVTAGVTAAPRDLSAAGAMESDSDDWDEELMDRDGARASRRTRKELARQMLELQRENERLQREKEEELARLRAELLDMQEAGAQDDEIAREREARRLLEMQQQQLGRVLRVCRKQGQARAMNAWHVFVRAHRLSEERARATSPPAHELFTLTYQWQPLPSRAAGGSDSEDGAIAGIASTLPAGRGALLETDGARVRIPRSWPLTLPYPPDLRAALRKKGRKKPRRRRSKSAVADELCVIVTRAMTMSTLLERAEAELVRVEGEGATSHVALCVVSESGERIPAMATVEEAQLFARHPSLELVPPITDEQLAEIVRLYRGALHADQPGGALRDAMDTAVLHRSHAVIPDHPQILAFFPAEQQRVIRICAEQRREIDLRVSNMFSPSAAAAAAAAASGSEEEAGGRGSAGEPLSCLSEDEFARASQQLIQRQDGDRELSERMQMLSRQLEDAARAASAAELTAGESGGGDGSDSSSEVAMPELAFSRSGRQAAAAAAPTPIDGGGSHDGEGQGTPADSGKRMSLTARAKARAAGKFRAGGNARARARAGAKAGEGEEGSRAKSTGEGAADEPSVQVDAAAVDGSAVTATAAAAGATAGGVGSKQRRGALRRLMKRARSATVRMLTRPGGKQAGAGEGIDVDDALARARARDNEEAYVARARPPLPTFDSSEDDHDEEEEEEQGGGTGTATAAGTGASVKDRGVGRGTGKGRGTGRGRGRGLGRGGGMGGSEKSRGRGLGAKASSVSRTSSSGSDSASTGSGTDSGGMSAKGTASGGSGGDSDGLRDSTVQRLADRYQRAGGASVDDSIRSSAVYDSSFAVDASHGDTLTSSRAGPAATAATQDSLEYTRSFSRSAAPSELKADSADGDSSSDGSGGTWSRDGVSALRGSSRGERGVREGVADSGGSMHGFVSPPGGSDAEDYSGTEGGATATAATATASAGHGAMYSDEESDGGVVTSFDMESSYADSPVSRRGRGSGGSQRRSGSELGDSSMMENSGGVSDMLDNMSASDLGSTLGESTGWSDVAASATQSLNRRLAAGRAAGGSGGGGGGGGDSDGGLSSVVGVSDSWGTSPGDSFARQRGSGARGSTDTVDFEDLEELHA